MAGDCQEYSRCTALRSLDYLIDKIWEELDLVKVYTKKRGVHPDLDDPVCLRKGATVEVRAAGDMDAVLG